jgi:hypothetical protein
MLVNPKTGSIQRRSVGAAAAQNSPNENGLSTCALDSPDKIFYIPIVPTLFCIFRCVQQRGTFLFCFRRWLRRLILPAHCVKHDFILAEIAVKLTAMHVMSPRPPHVAQLLQCDSLGWRDF